MKACQIHNQPINKTYFGYHSRTRYGEELTAEELYDISSRFLNEHHPQAVYFNITYTVNTIGA